MKEVKISVIIPVYKVENYLDTCLENVIKQTYKNLEIILVDDGSPDNSPKKCDEWAKKDNRIKVVHKLNGGVSSARNAGLDVATGEYVGFVDADDIIDLTMYEKLITSAVQTGADITLCGFKYVFENGSEKPYTEINLPKVSSDNITQYFLTTGTEFKRDEIITDNIMGSVCRTLIKKDKINNFRFKNIIYAEDLLFLMDLINAKTSIGVVNEQLYGYLQRSTSAVHTFSEKKMKQRFEVFKTILKKVENQIDNEFLKGFKFYNYASLVNEMLKNNQKTLLKEYMKDDFFKNLNTKENYKKEQQKTKGFKRKLGYFLVHKKMFNTYAMLVKLR